MPDTPRFRAALSPQSGDDTLSLVAGNATLETLLQIPAQAKSPFESLRGLSAHLSEHFGARLAFVSCRDTSAQMNPQFLFDTARSAFAAERARLFALELPFDVAIATSTPAFSWTGEVLSRDGFSVIGAMSQMGRQTRGRPGAGLEPAHRAHPHQQR